MQRTLDHYWSGVQITQVQLQKVSAGAGHRRIPRRAGGSHRCRARPERGAAFAGLYPGQPNPRKRGTEMKKVLFAGVAGLALLAGASANAAGSPRTAAATTPTARSGASTGFFVDRLLHRREHWRRMDPRFRRRHSRWGVQHDPVKVKVGELAHAGGEVHCGAAVGDFDLAPGSMHVQEDEQVGGSIALILAVVALQLTRRGRDRLPDLG